MGWVASFISAPVMRGFIEGLVYVTIIGQVPHLLGITGASGKVIAMTCEKPSESERPISHWSQREIADEAI